MYFKMMEEYELQIREMNNHFRKFSFTEIYFDDG